MHDETHVTPSAPEKKAETASADVPAWLQSAPETDTKAPVETVSIPEIPADTTPPAVSHDDVPDWLK